MLFCGWLLLFARKHLSAGGLSPPAEVFQITPSPGSFSIADWLDVKAKILHVILLDCKPLESLVRTLAKFFSHRYSQISDDARTAFDEFQLALATMQSPTQSSAANERLFEALCSSFPVYQKEMGMKVLHSHDAVICILNEHLDLSD
jgi:hypothetical protein